MNSTGMTMDELYQRTLARDAMIRNSSYKLTVLWTCEIAALLTINPEMRNHFEMYKRLGVLYNPLKPRQALYGGRLVHYLFYFITCMSFYNVTVVKYSHYTSKYLLRIKIVV